MKPPLAWLLCFLAALAPGFAAAPGQKFSLPIPPRLQWNANYGYCGEVSMISAGLYYGQYCSQYQARAIASPGVAQSEISSQLLLGVNAADAAAAMHLQAGEWNTRSQKSTEEFLVWVKQHTLQGHPVIIGLFTNEFRFYGDRNPKAGDQAYDHIVPVIGIGSHQPGNRNPDRYQPMDTIFFSDNGLWAPNGRPPYEFSSAFRDFFRSRAEANAPGAPQYSLKDRKNYGIAITGVTDLDGDTIPVRLSTSVNREVPRMQNGSSTAPSPMPLTLTATIAIPDQSTAYNLYLYDDFDAVPDSQFNAHASNASRTWAIPAGIGATHTVEMNILSNEIAVLRAVRATAP